MTESGQPARLGARLRALLELCPVEGPVADVGSGHGSLAYALAQRLPPGQVFATEARPGPAAELRRLLGERAGVVVLEGEGLAPLRRRGCRGVVVAGLGARSIAAILDRDRELALTLGWICLQPAQRAEWLSDWIRSQGCWSVRRASVEERGHRYQSFLLAPS